MLRIGVFFDEQAQVFSFKKPPQFLEEETSKWLALDRILLQGVAALNGDLPPRLAQFKQSCIAFHGLCEEKSLFSEAKEFDHLVATAVPVPDSEPESNSWWKISIGLGVLALICGALYGYSSSSSSGSGVAVPTGPLPDPVPQGLLPLGGSKASVQPLSCVTRIETATRDNAYLTETLSKTQKLCLRANPKLEENINILTRTTTLLNDFETHDALLRPLFKKLNTLVDQYNQGVFVNNADAEQQAVNLLNSIDLHLPKALETATELLRESKKFVLV